MWIGVSQQRLRLHKRINESLVFNFFPSAWKKVFKALSLVEHLHLLFQPKNHPTPTPPTSQQLRSHSQQNELIPCGSLRLQTVFENQTPKKPKLPKTNPPKHPNSPWIFAFPLFLRKAGCKSSSSWLTTRATSGARTPSGRPVTTRATASWAPRWQTVSGVWFGMEWRGMELNIYVYYFRVICFVTTDWQNCVVFFWLDC